jgi:hypothetical protein
VVIGEGDTGVIGFYCFLNDPVEVSVETPCGCHRPPTAPWPR